MECCESNNEIRHFKVGTDKQYSGLSLVTMASPWRTDMTMASPMSFLTEHIKMRTDNQKNDHDYLFKILLIGDSGVGKSALLTRYCDNMFCESYFSTIGVDFRIKTIEFKDSFAKLQIWDTAGQERFRSITKTYYRGANAIIIVFDIQDENWRSHIENWINEIELSSSHPYVIILAGNKIDQINADWNKELVYQEINEFANDLNCIFINVSAKTGENVEHIFDVICDKLN